MILKAKELFDFIQSLVASLAWPVTAIVIAVILKKPVQGVFSRLNKFKYGDAEASFGSELQNIKDSAMSANIKYDESTSVNLNIKKKLLEEVEQVANISPLAAIPLAWSQVESEVTDLINRLAISSDYPPHNSFLRNIELLRQENYLDRETFATLASMRKLRNEVAHVSQSKITVTVNEAIEYGKLAEAVSEKLKGIIRKKE